MRFPALVPLGGAASLLILSLLPAAAQTPGPDEETGLSQAARPTLSVPLTRGSFDIYDLPPSGPAAAAPAKAVIVFASDSSGWTYWEDRVGRHLSREGFYVLGLDAESYAADRYTQETVAADFERIAEAAPAPLIAPNAPVYFGGYGMGAAQAVAAAALAPQPPRLAGLILVALSKRGRYGSLFTDAFFPPRGPNTFSMAELAPTLGSLRVLQLQSEHGWFESAAWLEAVPGPHLKVTYPQRWREFRHANATFLKALDRGLGWLVVPPVAVP